MFLSRLNPVSVFHFCCLAFSPAFSGVSIPPKSGLSFSLPGESIKRLAICVFLSRLNPVSVFHFIGAVFVRAV